MNTATATTKSKAKKPTTECSAPIAEVHLVPIELIDVDEQLRTVFNQADIEELAADIAHRGVLQPVLLNPNAGRFTMIAGERRLRAVKHNGQDAIPALMTKTSAEDAFLMQLAENIQRENLSLEDESKAVAKLYERLGNLKAVSEKVKKSIPWCAKRYAMTKGDLNWNAKKLLEDGVTEDIELLKAFSDLVKIVGWPEYEKYLTDIRTGKANRTSIRAALKTAKANKQKEIQQIAKNVSQAKVKKPVEPAAPPAWKLEIAIEDLEQALTNARSNLTAKDLYQTWTDEQQSEVREELRKWALEGSLKGSRVFHRIGECVFQNAYITQVHDIEVMAMISGYGGTTFNIEEFLTDLQTPLKTD